MDLKPEGDGTHGGKPRAGRHAQQPGIRQRIAEQTLQYRARLGQGAPGQRRHDHPRQPDSQDDGRRPMVDRQAEQRLHQRAGGYGDGAQRSSATRRCHQE